MLRLFVGLTPESADAEDAAASRTLHDLIVAGRAGCAINPRQ